MMNGLFLCHLITCIFNLLECNHNITKKEQRRSCDSSNKGIDRDRIIMDNFLLPQSAQIKIGLFNQSFETQGNSISAKWNVISNDGSDRSFSCYP